MIRLNKLTGLCFAAVVFVLIINISTKAFANENDVTITILSTSDIHGKIYPWEYATDSPQEFGLAKLATLIKQERETDPDLILLDNGDLIESNMINIFNDDDIHPMINTLNLLKFDAMTLGNHEFNFGLDIVNKAIDTFQGTMLSANIKYEDGADFTDPYYVKQIKGVKVGVLGLTTPHIPRWEAGNPEHFEGLVFLDPYSTAQKYVDILKNDEKVDVIIGLFHMSRNGENYNPNLIDSARYIGENVAGIDAIIVGHEHAVFGFSDEQVFFGDTIALEPGSGGSYLGKINITFANDGSGYKMVSKNTDLLSVDGIEPDAQILEEMKYVDEQSKKIAYTVIGNAAEDFVPKSEIRGIPTAQVQDTALISLINEVQLFYTGADISSTALLDSRSNLNKGELQFKDVALIYRYQNTLQSHKMSGENLKKYMEWSATYFNTQQEGDVTVSFNPNVRGYNYDMFAGVEYKIDIRKPEGARVVELTFRGKPISDEDEFIIAVNNYRVGTLQSLGYLPNDGSSLVFDSTFTSIPEIQRLITKYIEEELNGVVVPKVNYNWSLIKDDYSHLTGAKEVVELINMGILEIPVSSDGRTPNVKSINVLGQFTADELTKLSLVTNIDVDIINKDGLTKGEVYKIIYNSLNSTLSDKYEHEPIELSQNDASVSDAHDVVSSVVQTPQIDSFIIEQSFVTESDEAEVSEIKYVVIKGDNLTKIAREFNTTWRDIAIHNKISNPDLILPGDVLIIR